MSGVAWNPPSDDLLGFRRACERGELQAQSCIGCGSLTVYPKGACPSCGGARFQPLALSGRGEVLSFSIVRRAPARLWAEQVPYVVAIVRTVEGPALMARIIGCAPQAVRIGMQVVAAFDALPDGTVVPNFTPEG